MKTMIIATALSVSLSAFAQVTYGELLPRLDEKSCMAPPSESECRHSIALIEQWMDENPASVEAATYDDLRTYYYVLSAKDSANRMEYLHKSVDYCLMYAEIAERKEKYRGYWNAAVGYFFLGDCANARKYLRLAKSSPGAKRRYRDKGTVRAINGQCEC